ncbi:MAG: ABC transporter substrate-binding protein [Gammaproteobacteria bacterium]|nr:ABC transporter substrate-binding protein [Gammaproteobacteria bacterium]
MRRGSCVVAFSLLNSRFNGRFTVVVALKRERRVYVARIPRLFKLKSVAPILAASAMLLPTQLHAQEIDYQHGISLLHELKYPKDFEHFEYADPDAPKGGKIVLSTTWPIVNFNGARRPELPNAVGLGRTIDRLMIRSADELSGLYGQLVDGVALSSDKRTLHMRLHEQARWHDGVPLTTADVQFTYDELMATVHGKVYFESWIDSLEILGPKKFAVHHRTTFTNANLVALTWFPVRPAHYWQNRDPRKATLIPPVASGPYRISGFDRAYVHYQRVDDYWGRDIPVNRGRYNFDEIRYEVYRDQSVAREAFRKGLFDIMFESDIRHWVASYNVPEEQANFLLQDTREVRKFIGAERALALNSRRPQLQDVRVREALTLAFDFEWQNRVIRHGTQSRALSYFANSQFASSDLPSGLELAILEQYRDQLPARVFTEVFELPVSTGYGTNRDAIARARQLLAEAGWVLKEGRLQNADGELFMLEFLTQDQSMQRVLLPYADTLKLLGIEGSIRLVDNVTAINLLRERNFDAYVREQLFLNPPIGELRNAFESSFAHVAMSGNMVGVQDAVVDELVKLAERATSLDEKTAAVRALDRVLLWGFFHIQINKADLERFVYWDKFGRPAGEASARLEYLVGSSVRVLDSWWVDESKALVVASVLN